MSDYPAEPCPRCGGHNYMVARNMRATRSCKCGHEWDPPPKLLGGMKLPPDVPAPLTESRVREIVREEAATVVINYGGPLSASMREGIADAVVKAIAEYQSRTPFKRIQ